MEKYIFNKNCIRFDGDFVLSAYSPEALLPGCLSQFSLRLSLEVLIYWLMSDP